MRRSKGVQEAMTHCLSCDVKGPDPMLRPASARHFFVPQDTGEGTVEDHRRIITDMHLQRNIAESKPA